MRGEEVGVDRSGWCMGYRMCIEYTGASMGFVSRKGTEVSPKKRSGIR